MLWVQREGRDAWHFHPDCRHFQVLLDDMRSGGEGLRPSRGHVRMRKTKPTGGDLCNQCKAKARRS